MAKSCPHKTKEIPKPLSACHPPLITGGCHRFTRENIKRKENNKNLAA